MAKASAGGRRRSRIRIGPGGPPGGRSRPGSRRPHGGRARRSVQVLQKRIVREVRWGWGCYRG
eukprot:257105-Alexandrium_andersonii.AAC.1